MDILESVLNNITSPQDKSLLEIGSHDDELTLELAKHFKQVYSFYEFLKIQPYKKGNIEVKKVDYDKVLESLDNYDVILLNNEFHHFSDLQQLKTYYQLSKDQELILAEWDFSGTVNDYYKNFQNCRFLCKHSREILNDLSSKKIIKITNQEKINYVVTFSSKQEAIDFFKFLLPDHYKFGKKEFLKMLDNSKFPLNLWEGSDVFYIKSLR